MEHEPVHLPVVERRKGLLGHDYVAEKTTLAVGGSTGLAVLQGADLIPESERVGEFGIWILCAVIIFLLLQVAQSLVGNDRKIGEAAQRNDELKRKLTKMRSSLSQAADPE